METMLINATHSEELRVALLKNGVLEDLDIENPKTIKKKANIYKGIVSRIEPSLEAAFIDYGAKRQGFLPLKEVAREYRQAGQKGSKDESYNIKDSIKENQEIMVQIVKEERGTKGAALTTYTSLAGGYLVLMPNNPRSGGISRRIEGEEREQLREKIRKLNVPQGMGVIARTSGIGKDLEELQWDLETLLNQWKAIQEAYKQQVAPFLIHQEGDVIIRSIRDNLRKSIKEIIIDEHQAYIKARNYIEQVNPSFISNVKLYNDVIPLFSRYKIESQIETAFQRKILLPSGGSIVIDQTEALVSIDINSAKSTAGANIETTAFNTNIEAVHEISRQMRLRDIGGLIVIDFIDMHQSDNQREVERQLQEAFRFDRARIQMGTISRFGLLEMSRQRMRISLGETNQELCPRCEGGGFIRSIHSLTFSIIHLLEEEAAKEKGIQINAQLPVQLATFILNEKRGMITDIEKRHHISILILPNPHLEIPNYKIERITSERSTQTLSYSLIEQPEVELYEMPTTDSGHIEEPLIKELTLPPRPQSKSGLLKLLRKIFQAEEQQSTTPTQNQQVKKEPPASSGDQKQQRSKPKQGEQRTTGQRKRGYSRKRFHHSGKKINKQRKQQ